MLLLMGIGMTWLYGFASWMFAQLIVLGVAGAAGVWMFYVQHQFEDTYWELHPEWDFHRAGIEGSSFLDMPRVMHWFTGNIGYHHVHPLSSRIPNYRLRECMESHPELQHVTRLTLRGTLRCARLKLWDQRTRRLVGFGDLPGLLAARETGAETPQVA